MTEAHLYATMLMDVGLDAGREYHYRGWSVYALHAADGSVYVVLSPTGQRFEYATGWDAAEAFIKEAK